MVKPKMTKWTEEEIEYLKDTYYSSGAREVGKTIGRTINAVRQKALELGMRKYIPKKERENSWWAVYRGDDFLTHGTVEDIAAELDMSVSNVRNHTYPSRRRLAADNAERMFFVHIPDEVDE